MFACRVACSWLAGGERREPEAVCERTMGIPPTTGGIGHQKTRLNTRRRVDPTSARIEVGSAGRRQLGFRRDPDRAAANAEGHRLELRVDSQLGEDVLHERLHGEGADEQLLRNLRCRAPLRRELEDLDLPTGQEREEALGVEAGSLGSSRSCTPPWPGRSIPSWSWLEEP